MRLDKLKEIGMICTKCGTEMEIGYAIKPAHEWGSRIVALNILIKAKDLELIPCRKCPKCGHSDDGR